MGMSETSVFRWMSGAILPDPHSLKRMAAALRCTTSYLAPMPARPTLAHHRERSGRTQADLGGVLEVPGWLVSNVEHGLRWPDDVDAWAAVYGVGPRAFTRAWRNAHLDA
jgi:hypothetical protein